ncbi:hypothetical protein [Rahnella sp. PCH160]|uniref:hypothetical protein n=1 Tax=Rahnella sp. PCH160 TaxID=3447928 RepID=UPI0039FD4C9E
MITSREATSEDYANFLKKEVETFNSNKKATENKRQIIESAFNDLSVLVQSIFISNGLECLIDMESTTIDGKIITDEYFSKNKPIECSIASMTFVKEHVSLTLPPSDSIRSNHCRPDEQMISFVLKTNVSQRSVFDNGTMSILPGNDYKWSLNEQYTLQYSEEKGWTIIITEFNNNKPIGIIKNSVLPLDDNNFLRILHSVFNPVIQSSNA